MWDGCGRAWKRFAVSLVLLNVLPVAWFIFLYLFVVPAETGLWPIVTAAVAALSMFGFHRILHAFIASDGLYLHFFTDEQRNEVLGSGAPQKVFNQPQSFTAHFVPGMIYIWGWYLLALIVRYASRC
jgi:hypothetical protein